MSELVARLPLPVWRLPSSRRCICTAAMATVLLYALSPFIALWRIDSAWNCKDARTLSTRIDWSALSRSLKDRTTEAIAGPPPASDDLPDFGTSFATTAVSHVIDTRLNVQSLLSMAGSAQNAPSFGLAQLLRVHARFTGINSFEAGAVLTPGGPETGIALRFEHWRWMITRIDLPGGAA